MAYPLSLPFSMHGQGGLLAQLRPGYVRPRRAYNPHAYASTAHSSSDSDIDEPATTRLRPSASYATSPTKRLYAATNIDPRKNRFINS